MTAGGSGSDTAALLEIRGLRKQYGGKVVLRSIDLDVARHEVVCLIGGSGSGKSTLLRCVTCWKTWMTARSTSTASSSPIPGWTPTPPAGGSASSSRPTTCSRT